jgi:hypothetical protein
MAAKALVVLLRGLPDLPQVGVDIYPETLPAEVILDIKDTMYRRAAAISFRNNGVTIEELKFSEFDCEWKMLATSLYDHHTVPLTNELLIWHVKSALGAK